MIIISILLISNITASPISDEMDSRKISASGDENNFNQRSININDQPVWSTEIDVSFDALRLIPAPEKLLFQKSFGNIKLEISELETTDFNTNAINQPDISGISDIRSTSELELLERQPHSILGKLSTDEVEIKHSIMNINHQDISAESVGSGAHLKQTVTLTNPTNELKKYRVSFIIESPLNSIEFDGEIIQLKEKAIRLDSGQYELSILDHLNNNVGNFGWGDLVISGFSPETIGFLSNGQGVIECSLTVEVEAHQTIELDPSYVVISISTLKLYNKDEWAMQGQTLATGDINNDGIDDLVFSASGVWSGPSDDRIETGEVYVLFGKSRPNIQGVLNFSNSEDVVIYGASVEDNLHEAKLAVGDINNDSFDDILIGAPLANENSGYAYVIFGSNNMKKAYDLASSIDYDIRIRGFKSDFGGAKTGSALSVGDVNADGFGDIIVSSPYADYMDNNDDRWGSGMVHLIHGNTTMKKNYHLALPDHYDMRIFGEWVDNFIGITLASGDINGDNFDDIVIGSPLMDAGNNDRERGKAGYVNVIFGNDSLPKDWDMQHTENISEAMIGYIHSNITIMGDTEEFSFSGDEIGSALEVIDLNNDNYDDILIGVPKAKGRGNGGDFVGEVYFIYGDSEKNLPRLIDTRNMSKHGYVIYGEDNGDMFGHSIVANDISGNGINDILIGAPGAWGISDDAKETGEVYFFYGSTKKKSGELFNLLGLSDVIRFHGVEKQEEAGTAVTSGDLDSDGHGEIIIGAPRASSPNGSLKEVGRIDVIFDLNVSSQISHVKFSLLDGGGNGTMCYAGTEHTFQIQVAHSRGIENLNFTQLSLEPIGPNIKFIWFYGNDSFYELSDRFGYASLNSSASVSRKISSTIYELDFKVIFDFSYPVHRLSSVQLYSLGYNLSVPAAIDRFNNVFQTENELTFVGNLEVTGNYQGSLNEKDRVHSLEDIAWSGLKVVYNGTTTVYPPDEYFDVVVSDDDGDSWFDRFSSSEEILIISTADSTDDASDIHTVNITNIPPDGVGFPEIPFEIRVEATRIEFTNPVPVDTIWHNTIDISPEVTINDAAGWEINGSSIEYSISTSGTNPESFGPWVSAGANGIQLEYTVFVNAQFANGDNNFIRWRAKNVATELYSGSEMFRILVDIEPVYYLNPNPDHNTWQYSTTVNCKITIRDNLSGVERDSIQYRYKSSTDSVFSSWTSAGLSIQNNAKSGYDCEVSVDLKSGIDNYIQWRAIDVMDNSDSGSSHFRIKVTTQKPITILLEPGNGNTIPDTRVILKWSATDPNADPMTFDVYFSDKRALVETLDPSVRITDNISGNQYNITELKNGGKYYWTVIPYDGTEFGECQSGVQNFIIFLPLPIAILTLPVNGSKLSSTTVEFLWEEEYTGSEKVTYDLYLDQTSPPSLLETNINTTSYVKTDLENGKTYFWYVLPKVDTLLGEITGQSKPQAMVFSIENKVIPPKVILNQPKNDMILTTQKPTLTWELSTASMENENISYIVLLDDTSSPAKIVSKQPIKSKSYTLTEPLEYEKTYYWTVIPLLRNIQGECLSGIWSFRTTAILPDFNIELEVDKNKYTTHPGEIVNIKFEIKNLATRNDNIAIEVQSSQFDSQYIELKPSTFALDGDSTGKGTISIVVPINIELDSYAISITATSKGAEEYDLNVQATKEISLIVSKEEASDEENRYAIYLIIIIVVIIIILILLFKLSKSRGGREQPDSGKTPETEPETKSKSRTIPNRRTSKQAQADPKHLGDLKKGRNVGAKKLSKKKY
jgi:hypothetical protein